MSSSFRSLVGRLRGPARRLWTGESGQGLVEYALIIAVVSLGAIVSLTFLKGSISDLFHKAGNSVSAVAVGGSGGTGGTGGGTPPPNGTPVNSGTPGATGGLPPAGGTGNDISVWSGNPGDGPAGFQNAPGVFWGDPGDAPPSTYPVTVTELGRNITVNGCAFTVSGYTFYGVWIREPSQTSANDWTIGGLDYEWACINAPAFAVVDATHFTSNFAAPSNGTALTGQILSSASGNDSNPWFSEDQNTNAPANTNEPGIYDSSSPSTSANYNYFRTNGTVWLCHWYSTASYSFSGGFSGQDNGCLATSPPPSIPTLGGGDAAVDCPGSGVDCESGELITATTSGWSTNNSPITSYRFEWAYKDDSSSSSCTSGTWVVVETDTGAPTTQTYQLPADLPGSGDANYRVRVYATNGVGESTDVADACTIVDQIAAPNLSAAAGNNFGGYGSSLSDAESLDFDPANSGDPATSYTFQWQVSTTFSGGSLNTDCSDAGGFVNHPSTGPTTAATITTTTATQGGTSDAGDRCYRVVITSASNAGGTWTGTATSSLIFANNV